MRKKKPGQQIIGALGTLHRLMRQLGMRHSGWLKKGLVPCMT